MRKVILSLGVAPALLGLTLAAGVILASPGTASAYDPCPSLAQAIEYHDSQGNDAYVAQLAEWGRPYNCGFE
jgi:hypothetical protein